MNITTILFDMDGTLLDSIEDIADSLNKTLTEFHLPTRTLKDITSFVGNGAKFLVEKSIPSSTPESIKQEFLLAYKKEYLNNLQNKTKPYDGIIELLEQLCQKGYKLGIISNKPDAGVKSLSQTYFGSYVQSSIGESITTKRKPAPDGIYKSLEELQSSKEESIYVGDSEVDILTSQNAGIPCIGVTWGFRSRETLLQAGATLLIDSPKEFIPLLNTL